MWCLRDSEDEGIACGPLLSGGELLRYVDRDNVELWGSRWNLKMEKMKEYDTPGDVNSNRHRYIKQ